MSEKIVDAIEADEYMSVAEFADRAGCSKQAVYQQLNKKLKPYVKVIDGKKTINSKALREVYGKEIQPENQSVVKEVDQGLNKELIAELRDQLVKKDQEIEKLLRMLEREQAQVAIAQSQIQQLQDKQHQETEEKKEEPETDQQVEQEKKSWFRRFFGL